MSIYEHIESLIAKVNERIGLLNRMKHLLPLVCLLYTSDAADE